MRPFFFKLCYLGSMQLVVLVALAAVFIVYCSPKGNTMAVEKKSNQNIEVNDSEHSQPFNNDQYFGACLEPAPGRILHGAQAEVPVSIFSRYVDWEGLDNYTRMSGHRPKIIMHYITFDPLGYRLLKDTIIDISRQDINYIPQIGLDFYSYLPTLSILHPRDVTQKIAEGAYDERIRDLARLFIKMDRPIFLRPGYEFGGKGQGRHASKKYWVDAWKRIYRIFKTEGAQHIAFVWHTLDAVDYMEYYPGDEYVDWWAVSVFDNNADQSEFLNAFIKDAARHRKPVMIAESTPRYIGSIGGRQSWEKWYQPLFDLVFTYPHIKALCYINASWANYPDKTFQYDARIQSDSYVSKRFGSILSDKRFIHND